MIKISKKIVILIFVALTLLGVVTASYAIYRKNNQLACNSDPNIIIQANSALNTNDNEKLNLIVNKIIAKNKYAKDPNCDLILMAYYINISDGSNAKKNYDNLQKVYDSKKGFNPLFNRNLKGINVYKTEIDLLISSSSQPVVHLGSGKGQVQ